MSEYSINNAFFAALAAVAVVGFCGVLVQGGQAVIVHAATHSGSALHPFVMTLF